MIPAINAQTIGVVGDVAADWKATTVSSNSTILLADSPTIFLIKDQQLGLLRVQSMNPICWMMLENEWGDSLGTYYKNWIPTPELGPGDYRLRIHFKDGSVSYQAFSKY